MPRKQGLVSIASILPDLPERSTDPGHIQALRRNSRTFTLADQIDRLVGIQLHSHAGEHPLPLGWPGAFQSTPNPAWTGQKVN